MPSRRKGGGRVSFVAPRLPDGRVMVVKNARTGEWMMPGGHVDRGEGSARAALRELREEAGVRRASRLRRMSGKGDRVNFYEARVSIPSSRRGRMRVFSGRDTPSETSDYGFVRPSSSNPMVVTDYDGKRKPNGGSFRKGTASQLKRVSESCKRLLRECDRRPGSCVGEGFSEARRRTCGR